MPDSLLQIIEQFHGSNWLRLAIPFLLSCVLLLVARGRSALRLSDETLRSVIVTMTMLLLNGLLASYIVLRIDLTVGPYSIVGLPHIDATFWERFPWPVTILFVVILFDLADYFTHRAMHNSLLWGVHAVHHSDQRLTWLSSSRVHVFETSIMRIGYAILLGWTGLPLWALGAANLIAYLHNRYVHCNLGWNHGPLAKLIASPNWHRWHHSVDPTAYNKNYANIFSALDVAFGTYYNPGPCNTEVGLAEVPKPGVINQMLYPFTYLVDQIKNDLATRRATNP